MASLPDPSVVWQFPWWPRPAHLNEWEAGSGVNGTWAEGSGSGDSCFYSCASPPWTGGSCPLACFSGTLFPDYVGCYTLPGCCDAPSSCQGLPQGYKFLIAAAIIAPSVTLIFAMLLICGHFMRYSCCKDQSSWSAHCRITSPIILMGLAIALFDWLTDAFFYATLSLEEKSTAAGYACLGCLSVSAVLIVLKVGIETFSCGLLRAEAELDEASRARKDARRRGDASVAADHFGIGDGGAGASAGDGGRRGRRWWQRKRDQPLDDVREPTRVRADRLAAAHAVRHAETVVLMAREVALRYRSWHWTVQARLCVAILVLEDIPELVVMGALGRLNFDTQSSGVVLVGVAVSALWAGIQLARGKRARQNARETRGKIEPARQRAAHTGAAARTLKTLAMADAIFDTSAPTPVVTAEAAPAEALTCRTCGACNEDGHEPDSGRERSQSRLQRARAAKAARSSRPNLSGAAGESTSAVYPQAELSASAVSRC